jgi:hypothetical protein
MDFEDLQERLEELIAEMDYVKGGLLVLEHERGAHVSSRQYENVSLVGLPGKLKRAVPSRKIAFCSVCNRPSHGNDHQPCITHGFKSNRNRWEAALYLASVD